MASYNAVACKPPPLSFGEVCKAALAFESAVMVEQAMLLVVDPGFTKGGGGGIK